MSESSSGIDVRQHCLSVVLLRCIAKDEDLTKELAYILREEDVVKRDIKTRWINLVRKHEPETAIKEMMEYIAASDEGNSKLPEYLRLCKVPENVCTLVSMLTREEETPVITLTLIKKWDILVQREGDLKREASRIFPEYAEEIVNDWPVSFINFCADKTFQEMQGLLREVVPTDFSQEESGPFQTPYEPSFQEKSDQDELTAEQCEDGGGAESGQYSLEVITTEEVQQAPPTAPTVDDTAQKFHMEAHYQRAESPTAQIQDVQPSYAAPTAEEDAAEQFLLSNCEELEGFKELLLPIAALAWPHNKILEWPTDLLDLLKTKDDDSSAMHFIAACNFLFQREEILKNYEHPATHNVVKWILGLTKLLAQPGNSDIMVLLYEMTWKVKLPEQRGAIKWPLLLCEKRKNDGKRTSDFIQVAAMFFELMEKSSDITVPATITVPTHMEAERDAAKSAKPQIATGLDPTTGTGNPPYMTVPSPPPCLSMHEETEIEHFTRSRSRKNAQLQQGTKVGSEAHPISDVQVEADAPTTTTPQQSTQKERHKQKGTETSASEVGKSQHEAGGVTTRQQTVNKKSEKESSTPETQSENEPEPASEATENDGRGPPQPHISNTSVLGRGVDETKALAAPRNVSLNRMDDSPSNSVVLKFSEAGSGVENCTATLLKGIDSLQEVRPAVAVHSGHIYTNLEPNTAYVAKVQSMSSSNAGVPVMSEPVYTAPGKVHNVVVERCDINGNLIKATWNAAYSCKTYEVQITRNKTEEALLRVDQPQCLHSCLGAGVTYHIRVRAHSREIYGEWSEEVSITLVPGPVHIKSAKPVDRGIEVQWKGPARDILNHRYIISLFTKAGRFQQERVSSEITNHRFKELLPGKQYFCSVSAENEAGCGLAEKSDWIKIPWVKPENFVVQLKPEDPSHEALFTWDHPDGVDGFKLVIDGPEFQRCFEIAQNEFLFTIGSPGTTYNCRLHNGCDGIYDPDAVTLPQPLVMAPGPPTNIKVIPDKDPNQLQIQFDEPAVKPERYEISALDVDENIEHRGDYISPYCQFTELQLGKKYKLLIQSVNGENLGSRKTASDLFETYPPKVQDLVLSSCCNESAMVKWICPSQYVKRFIIQFKCGNKQFEQFTAEQEFKITGLKRSRVYHVTVAAENSAGQGEFSTFLEFQTALANLTHVKIHKSEHQPSTSLVVEIKDPDRKSKAYVITAKAKSDGTAVTQRTQQLTCAVSGLRSGETYDVFVRAESGNKVSKTAYAPEPYMTIPDKVKDVQAESTGAERNIVRWSELPFPCSYQLRWKSATEGEYSNEEVGLNKRFYEWELGLKPGTKYLVQVAGENRAGQGEWSDIKTFTTVGEQAESSDQGGSTTIFDGKVNNPAFFNHAQNVSTDSSTKMGDVKVVNFNIQGIGGRSAQNPALTQGPNDTRQAIMSALDRFLDPSVPSTDIPSTSGINNQALCLTEEEDVMQNQDDDETAPKRLGTVLGSDDEDRQSEEESEDGSPEHDSENHSSMQHHDVRQSDGEASVSDGDESTAPLVCEDHERNEEERPAGPREQAPTVGRRLSRWFSCCIRGRAPDNDQQSDALLHTDRQ